MPAGDLPYDHLPLAAVIEFGMNADRNHLCGDISRLSHLRANVERPFIAHFYRFSGATKRISRRDWSLDAKGRCELEEIKQMLATPRTRCRACTDRQHRCIHLQEPLSQPACPPRPIVVYCAVANEEDPGRNGIWEVTASGIKPLAGESADPASDARGAGGHSASSRSPSPSPCLGPGRAPSA